MFSNIGLPGLLIIFVIMVVPFWRLLPKFGLSKWISLLAVVPFVPVILLWILAFRDTVSGPTKAALEDTFE